MYWNTKNSLPGFINRDIFVVCKDKKEGTVSFTGSYLGAIKKKDITYFFLDVAGKDLPVMLDVNDILSWVYIDHLVYDAQAKAIEENIEIVCPECGESCMVVAEATELGYVSAFVKKGKTELAINWDTADVECEFEYVCSCCGAVVAKDLNSLEKLYKKQQKKAKA